MSGTVLSVSSRAMIQACAKLGLDTERILPTARIDRATIDDPDARITLEQSATVWQKAYELSGDPNLALHAIEVLPPGAHDAGLRRGPPECLVSRRRAGDLGRNVRR